MKKGFSVFAVIATLFVMLFATVGCSVTLNETELTLKSGDTYTLVLKGAKDVVWEVSDDSVATVKADGKKAVVTAMKAGKTTVNVLTQAEKAADREVLATCEVTVEGSPLFIFLPESKLVLTKNTSNNVATVKAIYTEEMKGEPVWTSSDETIGTVEAQGLTARVTALARGECMITVTVDGYTAHFMLLVGTK